MELQDFFVGQRDRRPAADPQPRESHRLIIIEEPADYNTLLGKCNDAIAVAAGGGYIAVVIRLADHSHIRRLASFFMLPLRLVRVSRAIRDSGATVAGLFGISPDLRSPTIIFPLAGSATRYAQTNLLPVSPGPFSAFRGALAWWAGCDVSIAAVLMIGRKL